MQYDVPSSFALGVHVKAYKLTAVKMTTANRLGGLGQALASHDPTHTSIIYTE